MVWQAGYGNPVALNNFLNEGALADSENESRWSWIDLESGIPALIPINPLTLIGFYLPKSLKHRGPLFDDVDAGKLRVYLDEQRDRIVEDLGDDEWDLLIKRVDLLDEQQQQWKSMSRLQGSIQSRLSKESITQEQANWYAGKPVLWYSRLIAQAGVKAMVMLPDLIGTAIKRVRPIRWLTSGARFCLSQAYRTELAQRHVGQRIDRWSQRNQISEEQADHLCSQLGDAESSSYLTDFCAHLAIKPLVKVIVWWLMPVLCVMGYVSTPTVAVFMVFGGPGGRTSYTVARSIGSVLRGRALPWVALLIGALPVVGNLAYPMQIVYSGSDEDRLSQFIVCDFSTRLGRLVPIWGGADTATEHLFNRVSMRLMKC